MKNSISLNKRRVGIIVNYLSIFSIVVFWEYCEIVNCSKIIKSFCIIPLLIVVISFIVVYWKTGFWHFVHKSINKLDERELQLTSLILRYSYGIFTVLVLLILLLLSIFERPVSIILAVSLIYIAHIIPASIIAWRERATS